MTSAQVHSDDAKMRAAMQARGLEFIRLVVPDFVGQLRGKFFPCSDVDCTGEEIPLGMNTFSHRGKFLKIPELVALGYGNGLIRPIPETLFERSWIQHRRGAKVGQVMCELFYADGSPVEEDVRRIARKQVARLTDRNLALYSGSEFEFRMFKDGGSLSDLELVHKDNRMLATDHLDLYEDFMLDLDSRLREANIRMYSMHSEDGTGELEIPLVPTWGIDTADHSVLFRALVKETAVDHGQRASFMTVPILHDDSATTAHFNHSLWRLDAHGRKTANVFRDSEASSQLSTEASHWLAGLVHHTPGLTALLCPTVNCYRRSGLPAHPQVADWDQDDRRSTFRVKTGPQESDTFIENRLPSSAANPYLVLAGTIAAGVDGLDNRMKLPSRRDSGAVKIPRTLPEALDALKADDVLCEALGRRFIEWYVFQKEEELTFLKGVDVTKSEPEDMKRERENFLLYA